MPPPAPIVPIVGGGPAGMSCALWLNNYGLHPVIVERPNFSFIEYASRTTDTTSELYNWTKTVFLAFRELELRLLLDELRPRLRSA